MVQEPAKSRLENNQCPSCGKSKNEWNRRKDWRCCSMDCTEKFELFKVIRSWPDLRRQTFIRDKFTCAGCRNKFQTKIMFDDYFGEKYYATNSLLIELNKEEGFAIVGEDEKLIADHIKAIALGGEQWDSNNIQTLCIGCNKEKTREDAGKIAQLRRIERNMSGGQTLL